MTKLNEAEVRVILVSDAKYQDIADYYGVHYATISDIKLGKTWKHVEGQRYDGVRLDNKVGVRGVSLVRQTGRYNAKFMLNKKLYCLGSFKTVEEASEAINKKKQELA